MSKFFYRILSVVSGLLICLQVSAQVNDAGLWLNVGLEKKITQKFSAQFSHALRYNENISELGTSFSEIGLSYKIIKPLTFNVVYRFAQKKRVDDFYSNRHRYAFNVVYRLKIHQFKLNFREQYQSSYKDIGTSETGSIPTNHFRSKITIAYDLEKKYTPFISYELFYEIVEYIDNMRYKVGVEYELDKFNTFNLYYMIDKEMNVKKPWTSYVIGLGYNFTF
ncbi:MAG: DUF2490 domain-containing protein [Flavobacteriales bacterium]